MALTPALPPPHRSRVYTPITCAHTCMHANALQVNVGMANKHRKQFSTLLVIRKLQIKTTMSYYFIPLG